MVIRFFLFYFFSIFNFQSHSQCIQLRMLHLEQLHWKQNFRWKVTLHFYSFRRDKQYFELLSLEGDPGFSGLFWLRTSLFYPYYDSPTTAHLSETTRYWSIMHFVGIKISKTFNTKCLQKRNINEMLQIFVKERH